MADLKDFDKLIGEAVGKKALKIIDSSIKDNKDLLSWVKLYEVPAYAEGKHKWIPELIRVLTESFQFLEKYKDMTDTTYFEQIVEVKIEQTSRPLEMYLYVRGIDPDTNRNIRAVYFGGEFKEDDKTLLVDANTNIGFEQIQTAADKLSQYFMDELSDQIRKELKNDAS